MRKVMQISVAHLAKTKREKDPMHQQQKNADATLFNFTSLGFCFK